MPIKKSDLYASIWKSCDQLRGGGWMPLSTRIMCSRYCSSNMCLTSMPETMMPDVGFAFQRQHILKRRTLRDNQQGIIKKRQVKQAVKKNLPEDVDIDLVMDVVKNQHEY